MKCFCFLALLVTLNLSAIAVQKSLPHQIQNKATQEQDRQKYLHKKGVEILREVANDAIEIDNLYSSIRIKAKAADLLWPYDNESSRRYLISAFDQAVIYYSKMNGAPEKNNKQIPQNSLDLRLEIIQIAAHHDEAFSQELQEEYIAAKKNEIAPSTRTNALAYAEMFGAENASHNYQLEMASAFLDTNINEAVRLAQLALRVSIPYQIPNFLNQLASRDQAKADQLYLQALELLNKNQATSSGQLLLLSAYPFGEKRMLIFDGVSSNFQFVLAPPPNFVAQNQLIQAFISTAIKTLFRTVSVDRFQLLYTKTQIGVAGYAASYLQGKIIAFRPAALSEWLQIKESLLSLQTDDKRKYIEGRSNYELKEASAPPASVSEGKVERLLEQVDNSSNMAERDDWYVLAAFAARESGNYERALSIVSNIKDINYKMNATALFSFDLALAVLEEKNVADVERLIDNVKYIDQRVYLRLQLARQKKNQSEKGALLEVALQETIKSDQDVEKLRAIIAIANFYLSFDAEKGKDVAVNIPIFSNSKIHSDDFQASTQFARTLTSNRGSVYRLNVSDEGFDIRKVFIKLTSLNTEDAISLARSISPPIIRSEALLAIGGAILNKVSMKP